MPRTPGRRTIAVLAVAMIAAFALVLLDGASAMPAVAQAAPPNDGRENAVYFELDTVSQSFQTEIATDGATLEPGEPRPCGNIGATVWYRLELAVQGAHLVVDTAGSDFDTVVAVHLGGPTPVACNDNAGGAQASIDFAPEHYTAYWLQVGGANGATGRLRLDVHCQPACPPLGDRYGQYELPGPTIEHPRAVIDAFTAGATLDPGEPRPCGNIDKTVWYGFAVTSDRGIVVDAARSDFDVVLAVYAREPQSPAPPAVPLTQLGCEAAAPGGPPPRIEFQALGGKQYWIQAGGLNGDSGALHVEIACEPIPCPPGNDGATNPPLVVIPAALPFDDIVDTRNASAEVGEPMACVGMTHTVWYLLDGDRDAGVRITVEGVGFEPAVAVYRPAPNAPRSFDNLQAVACNAGGHGQRTIALDIQVPPTDAGTPSYVQIGSRGASGGQLAVHLAECAGPCAPDAVAATATPVSTPPPSAAGAPTRAPGRRGVIHLPDTGSGGYLPDSRR